MTNFNKKTAIVTGGTRGIGKEIANLIWQGGGNVIITGTRKIKQEICSRKRWKYAPLDFLSQQSIKEFLEIVRKMEQIDILINNAGINLIEPINELNEDNWDKVLKVNLTGPMLITKGVSRIMKRGKSGKILNVSSIFGVISKAKRSSYSASKSGLIGLTRAMALDLAGDHILVNALCPGFVLTELTKTILAKAEITKLSAQVPLGRFANAKEIAQIAVFLCSSLNSYVTGQTVIVDGGFSIK